MPAERTYNYTCNDYRLEMVLLGLKRRLSSNELTKEERSELKKEIKRLEKKLGL